MSVAFDSTPLPTATAFGNVVLLMGGWSAEREISLRSGAAVKQALEDYGVAVTVYDPIAGQLPQLPAPCDRVFNILHGRGGEDGCIQAVLDILNIPYTGSGVLASALAMDKMRSKLIWQAHGLPTPKAIWLTEALTDQQIVAELGLPLAIKPVAEGSSLGISKVETIEQLAAARALASQYGVTMAEQWIRGHEYTVGILQQQTLPSIRIETDREFYDYQAKYHSNTTQYHCPAGLSASAEQHLQQLALQAFKLLAARAWGRVDFILDQQQQPWLIELNTIPGMTDHSLIPMAARAVGMDFNELVLRILATTLEVTYG